MTRVRIPLSGTWEFRFEGEREWRRLAVPGCWELLGGPKDQSGPGWYRTHITLPEGAAGRRAWLRFDGVSYDCAIFVNGEEVGAHTGLWDSFAVDITGAASPGAEAELLVCVEKPASLTAGPDSSPVPGRFPLRGTLAGFLPYVWGHIFGGIWQDVWLEVAGPTVIEDVQARGTPEGRITVSAALSGPAAVTLDLLGPDGELICSETQSAGEADQHSVAFSVAVAHPRPWSPHDPALYTAVVRADGDERRARFGLRDLRAEGTDIVLNGRPIYPRLILSWGWYAESLNSNPGPERVRADFEKLKALGYNGVKLCLWVPPQYYFELADELGMLLWVELPMWLPRPDERFRRQVAVEYERLVRQSCHHPSVILYSLGCELNRAVGPDILGPLYAMVKRLAPDALVRDNSGSGEAYGGLLNEFADYYDYHFYSDIHFFRNLIDYFTPRWRPVQPWVFGEFCDLDTFRAPPGGDEGVGKRASLGSAAPWWASADAAINPQGARWQFDLPWHAERLRANGLWERAAELERLSRAHALLHRKWTIETVRTYREIGGYVITGEVDTPISTAGMLDDAGALKFDPEAFRAFNGDVALLVGWDKRRDWVNGGDRAAYWDTWSYPAGAQIRPHLIVSHYGAARGLARVAWSVTFDGPGEAPFAQGEAASSFELAPGDVREVAVAELSAPAVDAPRRATLRATLRLGDERAENAWPLWFFPRDAWAGVTGVALHDPAGVLRGLERLAPGLLPFDEQASSLNLQGPTVVIATAWSPALDAFVRGGGSAVLLQGDGPPGPVPTVAMPFWREAVRVAEPHPAWGDFPHDGWADLQFFGCATDCALDTAPLGAQARPILRRVDTRTMAYHDYAAELAWGAGRLIVTTLRLAGGHGEQPVGIARNTAAAYLLLCWVRFLGVVARRS